MENQSIDFLPKGSVIMWYGKSGEVPYGWVICDGREDSSFGGKVPDLRGRFVVGAESDDGKATYGTGKTGGLDKLQLTENQIPKHKHTGTTNSSGEHTHNIFPKEGKLVHWHESFEGDSGYIKTVGYDTKTNREPHKVSRPTDAITGNSGNHEHSFTTDDNRTNGDPIDIRPPYFALYYIIKVTDKIQ